MTFKRFFQLFIFYALSILIPLSLIKVFQIDIFWSQALILIIIGYIILGLPLTMLSLLKKKKSNY